MDLFFEYKEFKLHYLIFGKGTSTLFALHGFGQDASIFECLTPSLENKFKIVSVNIFFHKQSKFPHERISSNPMSKDEFWELFEVFVKHIGANRFSFIGYSLGGKIILNLVEKFYHLTDNIILVASDGLKIYPMNYIGTRSKIIQSVYKKIIDKPERAFTFLLLLKKIGFINSKTYDFFRFQMDEKWRRQLTYDVWMSLKLLMPDRKKIKMILNSNKIRCVMIFGQYDTIIKTETGKRFAKEIHGVEFFEVASGHNLISEKLNVLLSELF